MEYVLYIDYKCEYKPMTSEYREMVAETLMDAVIEADAIHDQTMYLIKIMEKTGRVEKVASGVKSREYMAIMEKRSIRWTKAETVHRVKQFMTKYGSWFEIQ